jgi:hypothetical protein
MKGFFNFVGAVVVVLAVVGACTDGSSSASSAQRTALVSLLQENDGSRNALNRTIEGRRSQVAYLDQQVTRQSHELAQFRARVEAFMMDHKMAIAALVIGGGGIGVALNEGNAFTPDEQWLGGIAAFLAIAYALGNAEEVVFVADQLIQADAHFKRLERQLHGTAGQLQAERTQLQQEEQQLAALVQKSGEIRAQLAALG